MRIIKSLPIFPILTLAATLCCLPTRAEDSPEDSQIAELTPQVQALLDELRKMDGAQPTPETSPTPTSAAPVASGPKSPEQKPGSLLMSIALKIGTLGTSRLAPSAPLGGRGLTGGTPTLSAADWRQLFPLKDPK